MYVDVLDINFPSGLQHLKPQKHLVISANMDLQVMNLSYKNFSNKGLKSVLFTKIDESVNIGYLYNFQNEFGLPMSYVTFGQNVPEDIMEAQRLKIAVHIIGEEKDLGSSYCFAKVE